MPFYEYQCKACGHDLEAMQKINDAPLKKCPHCGKSQLQRLMSAPVFRLKGAGWYETDFKGDQDNKKNLADRPEADAAKEPAKEATKEPDGKSDAKSDSMDKEAKTTEPKDGVKAADKPADKAAGKPAEKTATADSAKKASPSKPSKRGAVSPNKAAKRVTKKPAPKRRR
jgi:putative FmdB family regulatory protein